ncbi:Uncharacterised protein [Mycobacteroides abscessus subsp. massiliense]|nr:Uncharacterised protein [Mycobacteroides abscessus subsp. massiliense]
MRGADRSDGPARSAACLVLGCVPAGLLAVVVLVLVFGVGPTFRARMPAC